LLETIALISVIPLSGLILFGFLVFTALGARGGRIGIEPYPEVR